MANDPRPVPDALLLLTSSCPFCPTVLKGLSELVKSGHIGRLEVINLERHPEAGDLYKVRSVPWIRIGPYELDGLRSEAELKIWAERVGNAEGMAVYFNELLTTGGLEKVTDLVTRDPGRWEAIALLIADAQTDLHARVGIGALLEELQGSAQLARLVPPLTALTEHPEARLRSDACHYLGFTRDPRAIGVLERCLQDADANVREVAAESLQLLRAAPSP